MTAKRVTAGGEHAEATRRLDRAKSQNRPQSGLAPAPFWPIARVLHWLGYSTAALCLLLVIAGDGGLLVLSVGAAAAFAGVTGGALAERLGPKRLLKGISVKDALTPTGFAVPHHTRLRDLIDKHSFGGTRYCCAVIRDDYVVGVLHGESLTPVDLRRHWADAVERHMCPVDWIEAVDITDEAATAMDWMKRYRRNFLPVLDGSRLSGIVTLERIVQVALAHRKPGKPERDPDRSPTTETSSVIWRY